MNQQQQQPPQQQQQQPSSQPQMNDDQKRSNEQTDEDDGQSNEGFVVKMRGLPWSATADDIIKFLSILGMFRANYNSSILKLKHRSTDEKWLNLCIHPPLLHSEQGWPTKFPSKTL